MTDDDLCQMVEHVNVLLKSHTEQQSVVLLGLHNERSEDNADNADSEAGMDNHRQHQWSRVVATMQEDGLHCAQTQALCWLLECMGVDTIATTGAGGKVQGVRPEWVSASFLVAHVVTKNVVLRNVQIN